MDNLNTCKVCEAVIFGEELCHNCQDILDEFLEWKDDNNISKQKLEVQFLKQFLTLEETELMLEYAYN